MQVTQKLRCRLLGPRLDGRFSAADDEADARTITISTHKGRAVLAYLAMQPRCSATRSRLATLLWGDRSDELARQSLRQCLVTLRAELATATPDVLVIDRDLVGLRKRCVSVDAVEFFALGDCYELPTLERAITLYRGEFLDGASIDAETFIDWVAGERNRLQDVAARLLQRYAEKTNALGDGQKAIDAGQRLVALDPLREDWQRFLLQLHARYQGRDAAIAHARALTALLRKELNVDPSPATAALVLDIGRNAPPRRLAGTPPSAAHPRSRFPRLMVVPAKPRIVVLPFDDLRPHRDRDHFARGIAAEIVAALSCSRSLCVVACRSDHADAEWNFRELGVDYALKGSVRTAGMRMRIAAQLVDVCTGEHVWTGRCDHQPSDIFTMQEGIAAKIAASVEPHIYAAEAIRARRQLPHALDARGCVMQAISLVNIRSRRNYAFAEELLKRALELDPACTHAYSLLAYVRALEVVYGWKPRETTIAAARDAAQNAVIIDADAPWSHFALGYVYAQSRSTDEAIGAYEKALALNPNFSLAHTYLGSALSVLGRSEAALARIDLAERLCSREIFCGVNNYVRANAHFAAGRYREASVFARNSVRESPGIVTSHRHVVVNCALTGATREAKAALEDLLRLVPETSLRSIDEALPYVREQDRSRFLDAFYSVGIE